MNATDWEGALGTCAAMDGNLIAFDEEEELQDIYKHFMDVYALGENF